MNYTDYSSVLVAGQGASGKAVCDHLSKLGKKFEALSDKEGAERIKDFDLVVVSPGIPPSSPLFSAVKENGIPLIGELEFGYFVSYKPIIAVTGTNGKTTVTRLISAMTGGTACGNIGLPLTAAIDRVAPLVCEASSFQLLTTKTFRPNIAVITNISPDHLNYHGSMENYVNAKLAIAKNMTDRDYVILSGDINVTYLNNFKTHARVFYTSLFREVLGAYIRDGEIRFCGERICGADRVRLRGEHNLKNALSAVAAAKLYGADNDSIISALERAEADEHRIQFVKNVNGVNFFDDSKSTNILSTKAAVSSLFGSIALILGGSDKGLDYAPLFDYLKDRDVRAVILMGETAAAMKESAKKTGFSGKAVFADDMQEAVSAAYSFKCDNVLLSPATASFDKYENYIKRGEAFISVVNSLK